MPLISDFFQSMTFDPSSVLPSRNFLTGLTNPLAYAVTQADLTTWFITLNSPAGTITKIEFYAATTFVSGGGGTPPTGSVVEIRAYDAGGQLVARFDGLEQLNFGIAALFSNPSLLVSGADDFLGSDFADEIFLGSGDDFGGGGSGNDRIDGGVGNDFLYDDGNINDVDVLLGSTGNDILIGNFRDTLDGGSGGDIAAISFFGSPSGVTLDLTAVTPGGTVNLPGGGVMIGIEGVVLLGTPFSDTFILGSSWVGILDGGAGDDTLRGGSGADEIAGGAGIDQMFGGGGNDLIVVNSGGGNAEGNYQGEVWDGGAGNDFLGLEDSLDLRGGLLPVVLGIEGLRFFGKAAITLSMNSAFLGSLPANGQLLGDPGELYANTIEIDVTTTAAVNFSTWSIDDWVEGQDSFLFTGNAAANDITGSRGDDVIHGGLGNDRLVGFTGRDELFGEDGDDTLVVASPVSGGWIVTNEVWDGGAGFDFMEVGNNLNLTANRPASLDGIEGVSFGSSPGSASIFLTIDEWFLARVPTNLLVVGLTGGGRDDVMHVMLSTSAALDVSTWQFSQWVTGQDYTLIEANALDNTLVGTTRDDRIHGFGGADVISGGEGNDNIHGGEGVDQFFGGAGDDLLYVSDGLQPPGSYNGEVWNGGAGTDLITAFTSQPVDLRGANVTVVGVEGFAFAPVTEASTRIDQALLAQLPAAPIVKGSVQSANTLSVTLGSGDTTLDVSGWTYVDWLSNDRVEVVGSNGNNVITGSRYNDILLGGAGNDILANGGTNPLQFTGFHESMNGGAGDDFLILAGGFQNWGNTSVMAGGEGYDTLRLAGSGGTGSHYLFELASTTGLERVEFAGSAGETAKGVFRASSVAEAIAFLTAGGPGLEIAGSQAADVLQVAINLNSPTIALDLSAISIDASDLRASPRNRMNAPTEGLQLRINEGSFHVFDVTGSAADETIVGEGGADKLRGGGGNDILQGNAGADEYRGGDGDDYLFVHGPGAAGDANYSAEVWDGGNGVDFLVFGASLDLRDASRIANVQSVEGIAFAPGPVPPVPPSTGSVTLTIGKAFLDKLPGAVELEGANGQADRLHIELAAAGTVNLSAWTFSSWTSADQVMLRGSGEADTLIGSSIADVIVGGAGDDVLRGYLGSDTIDGGLGTDTAGFGFARSAAVIVKFGSMLAVGGSQAEGMDQLSSIEQLQFSDGTVAVSSLETFRVHDYVAGYNDLIGAYGVANPSGAVEHFIRLGFFEGRDPARFDGWQYLAGYNDLIGALGADPDGAARHFIQFGFPEGRQRDPFNGADYIASYGDLIQAFGLDENVAARHFVQFGHAAGRQRDLFDGWQYLASYNDLITTIGANEADAARHFILYGFGEGRSRDLFDGIDYIASYDDLIVALGADETAGARHFVEAGFAGGRVRDAFDGLQYIASYGDLIGVFGATEDVVTAARHFVSFGFNEGRSRDTFDAAQYLANYADLAAAYGSDLYQATRHYIHIGYYEGRTDEDLTPSIPPKPETTAPEVLVAGLETQSKADAPDILPALIDEQPLIDLAVRERHMVEVWPDRGLLLELASGEASLDKPGDVPDVLPAVADGESLALNLGLADLGFDLGLFAPGQRGSLIDLLRTGQTIHPDWAVIGA